MVLQLQDFIYRFLFAILVGALVGIERENARLNKDIKGVPIFGLRTTILFAVLGFFFSFFAVYTDAEYLIAIGVVAALLITTTVYVSNVFTKKYTGATTYITMLIVFFLGALAGLGGYLNFMIAAIGSIVTTAFLAGKTFLVGISKKLKKQEIVSAVKFGIIAFIILPLLPDRALDPLGIFNPHHIWYVVIVVLAIYFMSYIFMKLFSEKGIIISSLFGGLVSSSATTYQVSVWLRKNKNLLSVATVGVFLAIVSGILGDIFAIIFVFHKWDLILRILPVQATAVLFMLVMSFFVYRDNKKIPNFKLELKSPFALVPALKFGALYTALLAAGSVLGGLLGVFGVYPIAFFSSLISSSTFIISTAGLYHLGKISLEEATQLIIFSTIVAFLVKIFWVRTAKNREFTKKVLLAAIIGSILMGLVLAIQILVSSA